MLDEYADWKSCYLSPILNRSNEWSVQTVSISDSVISLGGFYTKIDTNHNEINPKYDLLLLIGGSSWSTENKTLYDFIQEAFNLNKNAGAICSAVDYLAKHVFLNHYQHTGNSIEIFRQFPKYNSHHNFQPEQIIQDKHFITANGTATLDFTEYVLKTIHFDTAENIKKQIFMNKYGFYEYCKRFGNPYT